MELFKDAHKRLLKSKEFKDWKKKHKDCYLSSGFVIVEKEQGPWKAAYYDKKKNKVTSFVMADKIEIEKEEEIFQKEKKEVNEVDMEKVKFELPQAIVMADNLQKKKYKGDDPVKIIAILQNLDTGQVWNLIYITQKFNTLNIKVDSSEGKIVEDKIASIMDFRKTENPAAK